jgi:nitrogen regulatory protein P-II 2
MKLVTAVIKPLKAEDVWDALTSLGVEGVTVSEVKGYDRQRENVEFSRAGEYAVYFSPKLKIEVAVRAEMVDQVVEAIISAAQTGRIGDGKIFVSDLDQVVRIRTRETGIDAL